MTINKNTFKQIFPLHRDINDEICYDTEGIVRFGPSIPYLSHSLCSANQPFLDVNHIPDCSYHDLKKGGAINFFLSDLLKGVQMKNLTCG